MNRKILFLSLLLIGTGFQGCQQKQQDTQANESTVSDASTSASVTTITEKLNALGLEPQGHWRGISLGDSIAKVKSIEKATLFESDASHVGYSVEYPNLESMDVLYYQNSKPVVSAIDVDLYLNTQQSVRAYLSDLSNYFSSRYGNPVKQDNAIIWTGPRQEKISLKDVSKGKDFGVKIKIKGEE